MKNLKYLIKPVIYVLAGGILGFFLFKVTDFHNIKTPFTSDPVKLQDVREGQGRFTNPLLECGQNGQNVFSELVPFKMKIESLINSQQEKDGINHISVYFRDLNNGPWFGIDEQTVFAPASLLKVPLAIAYYKLAEQDPGILKKVIVFADPNDSSGVVQSVKPKENLELGKSYEVEDLIRRMLVYSDNHSYSILFKNLKPDEIKRVYKDFGFNLDSLGRTDEIATVQSYSAFLRILYNASYLNQTDSEKVLGMLSESDFKNGLPAGVPDSVVVAHKFGERGSANSSEKQFSDCGIVYYPNHPYLMCINVKGSNFENQINAIKEVSTAVYEEFSSQLGETK
ncbi:MAG: serine hydrolase [Candidatus Doudnabacteria bacterium]|jgi:beta-lactamase class A